MELRTAGCRRPRTSDGPRFLTNTPSKKSLIAMCILAKATGPAAPWPCYRRRPVSYLDGPLLHRARRITRSECASDTRHTLSPPNSYARYYLAIPDLVSSPLFTYSCITGFSFRPHPTGDRLSFSSASSFVRPHPFVPHYYLILGLRLSLARSVRRYLHSLPTSKNFSQPLQLCCVFSHLRGRPNL